jgi:hypothetical protein
MRGGRKRKEVNGRGKEREEEG